MTTNTACMEKCSNTNTKRMERCELLCRLVPRSLIYISYGGLLMSLEGEMKHIDKVKYGDRVYCLIRTIK